MSNKFGNISKGLLVGGSAIAIALPFVAKFEGLRNWAYFDPVQIPTICYGHTAGVKIGQYYSDAECGALLSAELDDFVRIVEREVKVPMPETRKAALSSFVYNVGEGNFKRSTLLKKLNAGQVVEACNELRKWVYARGVKLNGLVTRREEERKLCLMGAN